MVFVSLRMAASLLRQRRSLLVFSFLFSLVIIHFAWNVILFQGLDVSQMYQPMKLLLLSYDYTNFEGDMYLFFVQLYPLLVVIPAGLSLTGEYQSGESMYIAARIGQKDYLVGRVIAAFLATSYIFTVPFVMEIILNCLSFPLNAVGDLTNWSSYSSYYLESVHNYLLTPLYIWNPYLYALLITLIFGLVSGLFAAFTVALSSVLFCKYQVMLFLPTILLINGLSILQSGLHGYGWDINILHYIFLFDDHKKQGLFYCGFIFVLVIATVALTLTGSRREVYGKT